MEKWFRKLKNIELEYFQKEEFLCTSVLNISEYKFASPYLVTTDVFNFKEEINAVLVATSQNGVPVFPFER